MRERDFLACPSTVGFRRQSQQGEASLGSPPRSLHLGSWAPPHHTDPPRCVAVVGKRPVSRGAVSLHLRRASSSPSNRLWHIPTAAALPRAHLAGRQAVPPSRAPLLRDQTSGKVFRRSPGGPSGSYLK